MKPRGRVPKEIEAAGPDVRAKFLELREQGMSSPDARARVLGAEAAQQYVQNHPHAIAVTVVPTDAAGAQEFLDRKAVEDTRRAERVLAAYDEIMDKLERKKAATIEQIGALSRNPDGASKACQRLWVIDEMLGEFKADKAKAA